MKTQKFIIFFLVAFLGCNDKNNDLVVKQLNELKSSNESLISKYDSINRHYVVPFKKYESIVISESLSNPDSLIKNYNLFIKEYPNSFWEHEAKRRLSNIKKRKKYWSKEKGWLIDDIPKKPSKDMEVISCPGC